MKKLLTVIFLSLVIFIGCSNNTNDYDPTIPDRYQKQKQYFTTLDQYERVDWLHNNCPQVMPYLLKKANEYEEGKWTLEENKAILGHAIGVICFRRYYNENSERKNIDYIENQLHNKKINTYSTISTPKSNSSNKPFSTFATPYAYTYKNGKIKSGYFIDTCDKNNPKRKSIVVTGDATISENTIISNHCH